MLIRTAPDIAPSEITPRPVYLRRRTFLGGALAMGLGWPLLPAMATPSGRDKLRGRPGFARLPIVLLTSRTELADIRNGLRLGADGYITKPYSKNVLVEVISRVLKQPLA